MKRFLCLITSIIPIFLFSSLAFSGDDEKLSSLDVKTVKVGGEIGRRIDLTIEKNLLAINVDESFLKPFLERKEPGGYLALGKLIDATVKFAYYSGDPRVIALKDKIIGQVIDSQLPNGYLGCKDTFEKSMMGLWDAHEMSYITQGLLTEYKCFNDKKALDSAVKLGDFILLQFPTVPINAIRVLDIPFPQHCWALGMDKAMVELYNATKDRKYLDFCRENLNTYGWDYPIVEKPWWPTEGHVYSYLGKCNAQLDLYRIDQDERLLRSSRRALNFLVNGEGMIVDGTCGRRECWHSDQEGMGNIAETCITAYLIRFMDNLLRLEGKSFYGDVMERSIYNALFAAQSPDGRKLRYFIPFQGKRSYFKSDTYCCPNNYRRIVADLPSMIYYRTKDGVAVNLYTESMTNFQLNSKNTVTLRQVTDYPNSGKVAISIEPSGKQAEMSVLLRIPYWCKNSSVKINHVPYQCEIKSGEFFSIKRVWKKGDLIDLDMPMEWRAVKGRRAQETSCALLRGPVLFCINPDRNPFVTWDDYNGINLFGFNLDYSSIEGPIRDDSIRPNGMACKAKRGDHTVVLTEFIDGGGEAIYFPPTDWFSAVEDELMNVGVK